jgi:hypothetical protein
MEEEHMNKSLGIYLAPLLLILCFFSGCNLFLPYEIPLPYGYSLVESRPGAQLRRGGILVVKGKIIHFRLKSPWLVGDVITNNNGQKRSYFIINLQTGDINYYCYTEPNERYDLEKHLEAINISLADEFYTLYDFKSGRLSLKLLSD